MDEIAIGQIRYDVVVLNLVLEFLHVHTNNTSSNVYIQSTYCRRDGEMMLWMWLSFSTCTRQGQETTASEHVWMKLALTRSGAFVLYVCVRVALCQQCMCV